MAQRWMAAKMMLGAKHGFTRSGCGRAMGGVWDDKAVGHVDARIKGKPKYRPATVEGCHIYDVKTGALIVARKTAVERAADKAKSAPVWKRPRGEFCAGKR
jgi:hypothetical protein